MSDSVAVWSGVRLGCQKVPLASQAGQNSVPAIAAHFCTTMVGARSRRNGCFLQWGPTCPCFAGIVPVGLLQNQGLVSFSLELYTWYSVCAFELAQLGPVTEGHRTSLLYGVDVSEKSVAGDILCVGVH